MDYRLARKIAPLRTIKDIAFPSRKKGMNPRRLSYLELVFSRKNKSVLFASFPSSGWNWCVDVLQYALGKEVYGSYEIGYDPNASRLKEAEQPPFNLFCPADSRATSGKKVRSILPSIDLDYCFHTHGYWGETPLLRMDDAKHILIVREPTAALFSYYSKRKGKFASFDEFLVSSDILGRMCHFYNSWLDFKSRKPGRMEIFTYEAFRQAPVEQFSNLARAAFGVDISEKNCSEAVEFFTFEKQKEREKKFTQDESKHFHYKGKISYKEEMGREAQEYIFSYLERNLNFDLCILDGFPK